MTIVFYLFALFAVIGSIMVVSLKNPIHSALALVMTLFSTAGIYILLNAEFIAVLEVIIYAGAIMVLFLFVLMCLNIRELKLTPQFNYLRPFAVVIGVCLTVFNILFIKNSNFGAFTGRYDDATIVALGGNAKALGQVLYSRFLLPFEVISVVLLVSMIGAIVLMRDIIVKGEK